MEFVHHSLKNVRRKVSSRISVSFRQRLRLRLTVGFVRFGQGAFGSAVSSTGALVDDAC